MAFDTLTFRKVVSSELEKDDDDTDDSLGMMSICLGEDGVERSATQVSAFCSRFDGCGSNEDSSECIKVVENSAGTGINCDSVTTLSGKSVWEELGFGKIVGCVEMEALFKPRFILSEENKLAVDEANWGFKEQLSHNHSPK